MGDNARKNWDWHNTEVGKGYQARGVVRQPNSQTQQIKIIDYSKPVENNPSKDKKRSQNNSSSDEESEQKKSKKSKKSSKSKSKHNSKEEKHDREKKYAFNPLLQLLASRLSDKTMSFLDKR